MIVAGAAVRAYPGQHVSGDAFLVQPTPNGLLVALVDALGHGPIAAEVAALSIATIRAHATDTPSNILSACHRALLRGRGAAISIVAIDHAGNGVFAGVGNVRARVHPDSSKAPSLLGAAGTVGHQHRTVREVAFRLPLDGIGVLHSDGVTSRVDPLAGPPLPVDETAKCLLSTYGRDTDDACVVVFGHRGNSRFSPVAVTRETR